MPVQLNVVATDATDLAFSFAKLVVDVFAALFMGK